MQFNRLKLEIIYDVNEDFFELIIEKILNKNHSCIDKYARDFSKIMEKLFLELKGFQFDCKASYEQKEKQQNESQDIYHRVLYQ